MGNGSLVKRIAREQHLAQVRAGIGVASTGKVKRRLGLTNHEHARPVRASLCVPFVSECSCACFFAEAPGTTGGGGAWVVATVGSCLCKHAMPAHMRGLPSIADLRAQHKLNAASTRIATKLLAEAELRGLHDAADG